MRSLGLLLALGAAACHREDRPPSPMSAPPASPAVDSAAATQAAPAPAAASPAPRPPEGSWTDWGPWVSGVRMRGKVPRRVLQGEELHPEFEFEFDPAEAPKGTTHFVTSEFPYQTWLVCKERSTERIVEVRPYDEGMMRWAEDEDRHLLSGPPPAHLFVTFFLSTVLKRLGPGSYEARLEFRDPLSRPRSSSSTDTDWQPPRVWTGVLPTAAFGFVVDEAPLEILRLRVPTRLSLARLRGERVIFVIYTAADSSNLDVVVHHGFAIGFEVQGGGALMLQGEPPEPDGVTQLGSIDPERTGPFRETYHLRVFETPEHGGHLWLPDSSDPDYRVLWSGTFTVDATKAEIEALRK